MFFQHRQSGFYVLNALRLCSIVGLVSAIIAATATVVKGFTANKFFLFDAANHVVLTCLCIFALLSELSLFPGYFERNWPLFGRHATLRWVGMLEVCVGFALLGKLNEDFVGKESIGTAFNTLLVASGVVVTALGVLVCIASFVYRDSATGITARMVRSFKLRKEHRLGLQSPTPGKAECGEGGIVGHPMATNLHAPAMPEPTYVGFRERYGNDGSQGSFASHAKPTAEEDDDKSVYSRTTYGTPLRNGRY